ncbi:hypothetical protein [Mycobacterium marseillense]|uniref:HNH endonuclease n=1 Tax=Mycobacterium marseillense TaxID=701042 RepID=A0ABN5ZRW7_9MYCO|nr:hypothetical protein [Mycobacterium marseillense]MCV7404516.1 hypothetical protein [Mycobacterium marseillense]BBY10993.1 hypothetical protein MMARJ_17330 [Mycobacterium marseillense]
MTNPRYANGYRRRQLRARVLREADVCWICDEVVDKELPTPHPLSPEVHEIHAVSLGGDPLDPANTVLTHRVCNQCVGATGQHRGTCILCRRATGVVNDHNGYDYDYDDSHAPAGQHCDRCGGIHHPRPGVAFVTSRTW